MECHRPFIQQASRALWEQRFSSAGEAKATEIKQVPGLMCVCPVSQGCHFIPPTSRNLFKTGHKRLYDKCIKRNPWRVLVTPTTLSENILVKSGNQQSHILPQHKRCCCQGNRPRLVSRAVRVEAHGAGGDIV